MRVSYGSIEMVRELPVSPVVGREPVCLPLGVLLAFSDDATRFWEQPLFDLIETAEGLIGSSKLSDVLRSKIWAGDWEPERFERFRTSDFLGIAGDLAPDEAHRRFDIVHYVGDFGRSGDLDDPILCLGRHSIRAGQLRDALVKRGTRLLILQSLERYGRSMLAEQIAEFIVGAGGPAVFVVTGAEMQPLNAYLADVYSAILRNQPLDEVAQTNIEGSRMVLVHGAGGTRLLQFDGLIERLGERLIDYSGLCDTLLSGLPALLTAREKESDTDDAIRLQILRPRVNAALRGLVDLTTTGWDESHRRVLALAEISDDVEGINREFGWHMGEGPLHTRFDLLEYRVRGRAHERPFIKDVVALPPVPRDSGTHVEPFTELTVFFGTNRTKAADGVYYGIERGSMLYGRCAVSVPIDRRIGTIPRPSIWTLYKPNRAKHFLVEDIVEQNRTDFVANLQEHLSGCDAHDALVFVHGFNVPFVSALLRTAQIAADLNFPGAAILFSWPSKGSWSPLAYTYDETQARWTLPDLAEFLELIAEQSGATTIHLLAHSMGNRALTEALGRVATVAARRTGTLFNEVLLTAPDIDADTFVRDIAPSILPVAQRVTLYASSNDKALAFSKKIHGSARAGESGANIVLLDGIDTIDVSAIDTNLMGHFYYGDNKSVLSDIFNVMLGQTVEKRFGLKKRTKGSQPYWVFQP